MKNMLGKLKNVRGLTFLEILIALTITGFVTTAVFRLYITQHKNYMTQDDVTEIQQNARASIDELSRNIRMAGFALPEGLKAIEAYDANPDTIVVNFFDQGCDTYLSAKMPQPSAELKCGTDISCFEDGQWVYIYDPDTQTGEWFEITHVQPAAFHIQHNTMSLSKAYDENAVILVITQVKYFIDETTEPDNPKLMIQRKGQEPQIFADNIIDLQFQYQMKNGLTVNAPILADDIRQVLIELSGRSKSPDPDDLVNPYRLRTFNTAVNLRNLSS